MREDVDQQQQPGGHAENPREEILAHDVLLSLENAGRLAPPRLLSESNSRAA
jgi:hypothetical protein